MNGLILINKPKGMTSHDVVNQVRKIFQTKRVGHLGTLDPLAEGLLVICLNDATKLVPFLENDDKTYLTEITIGLATTTYDLEGKVTESVNVERLNENLIDYCLSSFVGVQSQIPPLYSAIKIKGKKLYQYVRENKEVTPPIRKITIKSIKRTTPIVYENNKIKFWFEASVSKGTYIRSLCVDIAKRLGYPGVMSNLIRTKSGIFKLEHANQLTDLTNDKVHLISMIDALKGWHFITPSLELYKKIIEGMKLSMKEINGPENIAFEWENRLIGIYKLDNNIYRAVRIWK